MGLIRQAAEAALKQLQPLPGAGWGARWSPGLPGERNYRSLVGDGMNNSIVAACVLWIARQFPKASVLLETVTPDGRLEPVRSHPFLSLQQRPNPSYSGVLMSWAILTSFMTDGNAYKLKRRNDSGRLVEEWYVPHWMIEPRWPADGSAYLSAYRYSPGGRGYIDLPPSDVVHYRYGLDPDNLRKGRSPLKSLLREVYTDEEAARFTAALLHNLGVPGVILAPDGGSVEGVEAEAVKAKYQQEFGGDNRGQVLVMTGATTVKTIGFNPQELNLGRLREIPEERVSAVLGVPAAVVGFGTGLEQTKVGATMAELRRMAWEDGIFPLHTLLADEMETQELSEFESDLAVWQVSFDTAKVPELRESQDAAAVRWSSLVTGGIAKRSEGRSAFDLVVSPADEVYLQPFGIVEVPAPSGKARALTLKQRGRKASARDLRYLRELDRIARRHMEGMSAKLEAAFADLGERAERAYVGAKQRKQTPADEQLVTEIISALRLAVWQQNTLEPIYSAYTALTAEATYGAVSSRIGIAIEWDIADPVAQRVIASSGTRLGLLDLDGDTRTSLFRALEEGRATGEGPAQLARRIRDEVPAGPYGTAGAKYRAEMIARTETLYAQRNATLAAGESAGFDEYVIFDARLGPTDDECEMLDEQVVSLSEAETLVGDEHPNGTRSFSPVPRSGPAPEESARVAQVRDVEASTKASELRCSSCNRKLADAAVGFTGTCPRCKTINVRGIPGEIEGNVELLPDGRVVITPAPVDLRPFSDLLEDGLERLKEHLLGDRVVERRLLKDQDGRAIGAELLLASGEKRRQRIVRGEDGAVRVVIE